MTIPTLKKLIENHIDRLFENENGYQLTADELKKEMLFFIDLYGQEQLPDYTRPNVIKIDSTYQPEYVLYSEICGCNPKKGGNGMCHCTLGNTWVPNPDKVKITATNQYES